MYLVASHASADLVCDNRNALQLCSLLHLTFNLLCKFISENQLIKTTTCTGPQKKVSTGSPYHPCFSNFPSFKPSSCQISSSWISGWGWNRTLEAKSDACTHTHTHAHPLCLKWSLVLGRQALQCCINKCHLHYLKWLHVTEMEQAGCTAGGSKVSRRRLKSFSTACREALKIHKGCPKDSVEH